MNDLSPRALDEALWRMPTVLERTGLSESEIRRKEQEGSFPAARRIGERAIAWLASEVITWMRDCPKAQEAAPINAPPPHRKRGRPPRQAA